MAKIKKDYELKELIAIEAFGGEPERWERNSTPETKEVYLKKAEKIIQLFAADSAGTLVPKSELEKAQNELQELDSLTTGIISGKEAEIEKLKKTIDELTKPKENNDDLTKTPEQKG